MSRDPFFEEDTTIEPLIYCISRSASVYFSREMQRFGLGSGHFFFIRILMSNEGVSQNVLSVILGVDKGTTAKAMQKLTEAGFIKRETDPSDSRSYRLFLTESGKRIGENLRVLGKSLEELLTEGFSNDEKRQLLSLLQRAAENARKTKEE